MKRDPRIDPQPGDVLRKGTLRREVIGIDFIGITDPIKAVIVFDGGWIKPPRRKLPTMGQFRKWAANATVEYTTP